MRRHSIGVSSTRSSARVAAEAEAVVPDGTIADSMETETPKMVVAVRVRPLSVEEQGRGMKSCCNVLKGNVVAIKKEGDPAGYLRSQMGAINDYCFVFIDVE